MFVTRKWFFIPSLQSGILELVLAFQKTLKPIKVITNWINFNFVII